MTEPNRVRNVLGGSTLFSVANQPNSDSAFSFAQLAAGYVADRLAWAFQPGEKIEGDEAAMLAHLLTEALALYGAVGATV